MNREELFESHLKVTEEYARHFCRKHKFKRYNYSAVMNAARFGCFMASLKFDEKYGVKFWTYAQQKVKFAMIEELRIQSKQKMRNPFFEHQCLHVKYLSDLNEDEIPRNKDEFEENRKELANNLINKVKDERIRLILRARFIVGIKEQTIAELYEITPAKVIEMTKQGIRLIQEYSEGANNGCSEEVQEERDG